MSEVSSAINYVDINREKNRKIIFGSKVFINLNNKNLKYRIIETCYINIFEYVP